MKNPEKAHLEKQSIFTYVFLGIQGAPGALFRPPLDSGSERPVRARTIT